MSFSPDLTSLIYFVPSLSAKIAFSPKSPCCDARAGELPLVHRARLWPVLSRGADQQPAAGRTGLGWRCGVSLWRWEHGAGDALPPVPFIGNWKPF